jgi:MFS family permease
MEAELKKAMPGLWLMSFSTFIVCVPAAFTQILSLDLMIDLNAFPTDGYAWTFPAFVGGECASMAFFATVIDSLGRRKPYLLGSILFILGSIACAMCTEMAPFLLFRVIEGFGTGIIIIACIAQIFYDVPDHKQRYIANGIMSLGFGMGMLVGIFLGKAIIEGMGWQLTFWAIAALQAIVTYPTLQFLSHGETSTMKADYHGAAILLVLSGFFVYFLEKLYLDWDVFSTEWLMGTAFLFMLLIAFFVVEVTNPNSVLQRKVENPKMVVAALIFIFLLGMIDMAAVGSMLKIAFFTYQMSVLEAAPYFIIMVLGAATTAITISKTIDKTGHLIWFLLSAILTPIALVSMLLVRADDPTFVFILHLFVLGLAIGCLVSMLNATIQNRTNKDNNGAYMGFAIFVRTAALWLGYNFFQFITDIHMQEHLGPMMDYWNSVLPFELPADSTLANLLITPLGNLLKLLPGLTDEIASVYAEGMGIALVYGAVIFVVISIPVSLLLVGRRKTL